MRCDRQPNHRRRRAAQTSLANTAGAFIALVAIAATINSLPGANIRAALLESRTPLAEATTVRAVAAAVAAAARELAGAERITAALPAEQFASALAPAGLPIPITRDADAIVRSQPLNERLIDLPPPGC
jgi:hypothetical protein